MYYTLRRDYYWPRMTNDVFAVARSCRSCAKVKGVQYGHRKYLRLFPASGPLEFVAMVILSPLPKSARGNLYILVITDRFSKLAQCTPLRTTTAVVVAKAFLERRVYVYGGPRYLLTDNGKQFVAKFFESVCGMLGVNHFLTTAHHPQTKRTDRTV